MNSLQVRMEMSLNSLESYIEKIEILAAVSVNKEGFDRSIVIDLKKGVQNLKTSYQKILSFDEKENQLELQQATKVFYGIHAMIRPEIIATFVTLAKGYSLKSEARFSASQNEMH